MFDAMVGSVAPKGFGRAGDRNAHTVGIGIIGGWPWQMEWIFNEHSRFRRELMVAGVLGGLWGAAWRRLTCLLVSS